MGHHLLGHAPCHEPGVNFTNATQKNGKRKQQRKRKRERLLPYISWNRIKTTFAKNPLCSAVVVREKRVAAHLARCNKSRSQSAFYRSTIIIVCRPVSQALDQSLDCYAAFLCFHSFHLSFIHFHCVVPLRWLYYSLLRFISVLVRVFFEVVNEVIFVGIVCAGCRV